MSILWCWLQYKRAATDKDTEASKSEDIKKGGLDALLGSLQQAKTVNVLDKSRMDWGDFKSNDVKVGRTAPQAVCRDQFLARFYCAFHKALH